MPAEIGLFSATTLLAHLLVALGLIVLFGLAAGRLMNAFTQRISSPLPKAKDDSNAR